ncbi:MAG: hypothetical protein HC892_03275 [Saprospiraceae bacterium]|nr:hypothetical protein [Saprospiraceae bacterium]
MNASIKTYCLYCLLLFGVTNLAQGQTSAAISGLSIPELHTKPKYSFARKSVLYWYSIPSSNYQSSITKSPNAHLELSKDYYQHLGFFCKIEIQMERQAKMPVRFRLGEVDYVNRLEGKY